MSHFYGTLDGSPKNLVTACGTKKTGMISYTACYAGAIRVELYHVNDKDYAKVDMVTWPGKAFVRRLYIGSVSDYIPLDEGH